MEKKYYSIGEGLLSKHVIEKALNRLGALLKENNRRVEMVAAGGVISVLQFGSRHMTRDIDAVFPARDKALLRTLIDKVANELSLPAGKHAWLNGVSFLS
jgi:hypothetical protein